MYILDWNNNRFRHSLTYINPPIFPYISFLSSQFHPSIHQFFVCLFSFIFIDFQFYTGDIHCSFYTERCILVNIPRAHWLPLVMVIQVYWEQLPPYGEARLLGMVSLVSEVLFRCPSQSLHFLQNHFRYVAWFFDRWQNVA